MFIATFVSVFRYMLCFTKNTRQKVDRWNVVLASFTCGFAFLFEHKSRRNELVMFMLPRVLESMYYLAMEYGFAKAVKMGEVLVFAICMALLMYFYENRPDQIKPTYHDLLRRFFGKN